MCTKYDYVLRDLQAEPPLLVDTQTPGFQMEYLWAEKMPGLLSDEWLDFFVMIRAEKMSIYHAFLIFETNGVTSPNHLLYVDFEKFPLFAQSKRW